MCWRNWGNIRCGLELLKNYSEKLGLKYKWDFAKRRQEDERKGIRQTGGKFKRLLEESGFRQPEKV